MIKNINIRFNLDKEEHRKAWDYMQTMDRSVEKTYSKVIIKSLIRYFENADAENKAEISENYWERFQKRDGGSVARANGIACGRNGEIGRKREQSSAKNQ